MLQQARKDLAKYYPTYADFEPLKPNADRNGARRRPAGSPTAAPSSPSCGPDPAAVQSRLLIPLRFSSPLPSAIPISQSSLASLHIVLEAYCSNPNAIVRGFAAADAQLAARKTRIQEQFAWVESQTDNESRAAQFARILDALRDFPRLWDSMEPEERRTVFELLIEGLRIGRADGAMKVRLKLRFRDETVFELPICQDRRSAKHRRVRQAPVSLRQLAFLALADEGLSEEQIALRWNTSTGSVNGIKHRALANAGAGSVDEAVERMRHRLTEWRHLLPLDASPSKVGKCRSLLDRDEIQVLRGMAAGKPDSQMARDLGIPMTTVNGRRCRVRDKLQARHAFAAVAKAESLGLLRPQDARPATLLAAYERLRTLSDERLAQLGVRRPTSRQMECLEALVEGLSVREVARRRGVVMQSVVLLRQRTWQIVGASNYAQAHDRVKELGLLRQRGAKEAEQTPTQPSRRGSRSNCRPLAGRHAAKEGGET